MKNAKTEEDKAKMKDRWLQIDAEQNEEWLRKQGTGAYIDPVSYTHLTLPTT